MKKALPLMLFLSLYKVSFTQITVATATPQQCLNTLIGGNVQFSFTSSQGNANQFGTFNGTASNIGFNSGIVLSTAQINTPNSFMPPQALQGANSPGYAQLGSLLGNPLTRNASVITFQFTPVSDTIRFRYVFASAEYPGFVCSSFNDVFAFFLSGPRPGGGTYTNTNIALIPGTNTPVSINNVNAGSNIGACSPPGGGLVCPCNQQHFVNNYAPPGTTVNFSGFTRPLTAVAAVVPCSTYTITLAVADVADGSLNSAVFLEGNSFSSPTVTLTPTVNIGGAHNVLYEGCSFATIKIRRSYNLNQTKTYNLELTGSAVNGVDYLGLPQTVSFAPGETEKTLTLNTVNNPASNVNSQVTITVRDTVCANIQGGTITSSVTMDIINVAPLQVNAGPDLSSCDTINISPTVTGGLAPYTYSWNNGQFNTPNITNHVLANDQTFVLTVNDNCSNTRSDTMKVDIMEPPTAHFGITASATKMGEACGSVQVTVTRQGLLHQARTYPLFFTGTATPTADYGTPPATVSFAANQGSTQFTLTPLWDNVAEGAEYITVTMVDTLCNGSNIRDSLRIYIADIDAPRVNAGADLSTGCPLSPQNLSATPSGGNPPYTWLWSTGATTQNITVQPNQTIPYTVTMTDSCGNTATDTVEVQVFYPPVAAFDFNSADWCQPATVNFTNTSQSVSGTLTEHRWNFGDGNTATGPTASYLYASAGQHTVTLVVTNSFGCKDTATKIVDVKPKPQANFHWKPNNPTVQTPMVNFVDISTGNVSAWRWEMADLYTSTLQNPGFNFREAGEYPVTLYVQNPWGCKDTVTLALTVTGISTVYIPSAFTPYGDNLNETFRPQLSNIADFNMTIYSRWGEILYSTRDHNQGWTGRLPNGKLMKSDTYVYKIYAKDIYGKEFEYYGHVQLLGNM